MILHMCISISNCDDFCVVKQKSFDSCRLNTLMTDINVQSGINVWAGKFGKNNKRAV